MTRKLKSTLRAWACGFAALGLVAPACLAQGYSSRGIPEWAPLGLIALLFGVLALASWRIRRLAAQARQGKLAIQHRTEDLEREKAELVRAQEKMRHFAEHDDLTGLWNRRILIERLSQEVDRARRDGTPLSVILVDLDHFKDINDTFGNPSGDLVLKEIGAIFRRLVRTYDWVGRYEGEEFLLILPGLSFVGARLRAEQFRMAVQAARIFEGETAIQLTASLGVASGFPADYEAMIHAADVALYQAKNNGRNCVVATEIEPPGITGGAGI